MQVFRLGGRPSLLPAEPSFLALKEDFECVFYNGGVKQKNELCDYLME